MRKKAFIGILAIIVFYTSAVMFGVATGRITLKNGQPSPVTSSAEDTSTEKPRESMTETKTQSEPAADKKTDSSIILVNANNAVPSGYSTELVELSNGCTVSAEMYPSLQSMFDDAREIGLDPIVSEGFRTQKEQEAIVAAKTAEFIEQGYGESEAAALALQWAAKPGHSEHELGLAVDINSLSGTLDENLYAWLAEYAHYYGFIQRYPEGKEEITGIEYEPWHYRYVGTEAAKDMYESGQTLEEYLAD